jgi:hypothetical protein
MRLREGPTTRVAAPAHVVPFMQTLTMFQASAPTDRVAGASILAALDTLGMWRARGVKILEEHGIVDPAPNEWYSFQAYLDSLRFIYEKIGPATVTEIGKKLVAGNEFPPTVDSIEVALAGLDQDYRLRHHGADVGSFRYEQKGPREGAMTIRNPYPCELDRGVVSALVQRFRPPASPLVRIDHADAKSCRKHGAEACVLRVSW